MQLLKLQQGMSDETKDEIINSISLLKDEFDYYPDSIIYNVIGGIKTAIITYGLTDGRHLELYIDDNTYNIIENNEHILLNKRVSKIDYVCILRNTIEKEREAK